MLLCYTWSVGYNEVTWRWYGMSEVVHNPMSDISPFIVAQYRFRARNGKYSLNMRYCVMDNWSVLTSVASGDFYFIFEKICLTVMQILLLRHCSFFKEQFLPQDHWFPIQRRNQYKINTLCYKCITRTAPSYVCDRMSSTLHTLSYSPLCFWYSQPPESSHQTFHCWFPRLFCFRSLRMEWPPSPSTETLSGLSRTAQ